MILYIFKQRLIYKCTQYKIGYKEVNEAYTSKFCSNCANYNKYLGSNKIYDQELSYNFGQRCKCFKKYFNDYIKYFLWIFRMLQKKHAR